MAIQNGVLINEQIQYHLIDYQAIVRLNDVNDGQFSITNKGNANESLVSPGDTVSFYRGSSLVLEGVALAPFDYSHSPTVITVNVLGYGAELARRVVHQPHQYLVEKGRTLDGDYVIRGGPWQHGDGTFDDDPADTMAGWQELGTVALSAETEVTHRSPGSWKAVTSAATSGITKTLHFDNTKTANYWVTVWVRSDSAVTLSCTTTAGAGLGSTNATTVSTGSGDWEMLEIKDTPDTGSLYSLKIDLYAASGVTFYIDDLCYCTHLKADGTQDVWDNGVMANTGYDVTDVDCPETLDSFDTRDNTTIVQALRNLRNAVGANDYCWWFGPAEKALHLKEYPTEQNESRAVIRDNIYSVHKRSDPSRLLNKFQIITTSEESDWKKIFESESAYTIAGIWQYDNHIIVNPYGSASSHLEVSHDNGATWDTTKTFSDSSYFVWHYFFDEANQRLYIGTCHEGLLYSDDFGDTWEELDTSLDWSCYFQVEGEDGTVYEIKTGDDPSGKMYRRELGTASWTDITPTITGVNHWYFFQWDGAMVVAEGPVSAGPNHIIRTEDITAASPSWEKVWTSPGDYSSTEYGVYGCCKKLNNRTGEPYFYYNLSYPTSKTQILRSVDYGKSFHAAYTADETTDHLPAMMAANDGVVYSVVSCDPANSKYGRILKSIDDGDTWTTELDGDDDHRYSYAIWADRNTVILQEMYPDGVNVTSKVLQRTDAYNIVIPVEDSDSIAAYGEYGRTITDQQVQTRSVGERIGQGMVGLFSEPVEAFDVRQKVDTTVELAKTYMVWVGARFPLTFPISWEYHSPLPTEPMNVSSITYHYPRNMMDVKLGKELDDINSTLSDLLDRYIEENQGDEMAVATQDGTDEEPGYARTPTGKVTRPRGALSRGQNYVLNRLKRNGWGRARSW